jgi:SsrA-binding protein
MAKGRKRKIAAGDVATNRSAAHRYTFLDKLECGMELRGTEVKSIRQNGAQLKDGFAIIRDGEIWLYNVHIPPYGPAARDNHEPERPRRLLAHRREIDRLIGRTKEKGLTLVPTRLYFSHNRAKVEIAVARGKDRFDKRETLKKKDMQRDMQRALREVNR